MSLRPAQRIQIRNPQSQNLIIDLGSNEPAARAVVRVARPIDEPRKGTVVI